MCVFKVIACTVNALSRAEVAATEAELSVSALLERANRNRSELVICVRADTSIYPFHISYHILQQQH